ncbi:MAG: NAD(+) kinase [Gammaproteobacteria bacterium]|nr:NAD(+) kinase [Gammaproteobacteria bacterium]
MKKQFNTIGIIGKSQDPGIVKAIGEINLFCQKENLIVFLDEYTSSHTGITDIKTAHREDLGKQCDLVIVIGGDGTMLSAARTLCEYEVPLVGINLGRLGFLADISPSEAEDRLREILKGEYEVEERVLLSASIERNNKEIARCNALNDVVVHKWEVAHMIETDTYINGDFVHTHRSDGIITSTPTGSTAYALSGGGPIIQPGLEALVIVPICPHTLSNRPIAIKADSKIKITLSNTGRHKGQVTCDGRMLHELEIGDEVFIETNEHRLKLLHPKGHDYFQILRAKLHWAEHP